MKRGRKPKSRHLRLIEGTLVTSRHGTESAVRDGIERAKLTVGTPSKPNGMKGEAGKAWDRYIAPAVWLDVFREPAAIAFCELWAEYRAAPAAFSAARHSQMRAFLNLLDVRHAPQQPEDDDDFFA